MYKVNRGIGKISIVSIPDGKTVCEIDADTVFVEKDSLGGTVTTDVRDMTDAQIIAKLVEKGILSL
jgi:hypothetical protein